ncbi:efflux transporter outer membrane subunit [Betaproteobacteria bacterium SCN2]|jgi:NodT family efflux transporter outer membrane factor (OMF) lipoprotein|nr:efflux transporter outer membrane subunit [Betaproteobacteria bacterium SCN2]
MKTKLACFLLSLGLLGGCAMVGPDYRAPVANSPADWFQLGAAAEVVRADPAGDLGRWWQTLNDPLLSALVEQALRSSPDMRSAQARLRESRARRTIAAAGLYPELNASADARRSKSSEETGGGTARNSFSAGFDASWEADMFGGTRRGIEAADADLQASEAGLHGTAVTLAAEVALNYIELRAYQARLGIARANLASQAETLQLTSWRAQAGLVGSQDVEQARANYEQTRAQLPSLQRSYAEAAHRLAILLGEAPGSLHARMAAEADLPGMPASVAIGIPADTLRQRPDVRAAERRLAAETARVGAAEAARYPGFRLSGSIGLEALTFGALGSGGAGAYSLLAGISGPLFNAGRLRAQAEIQDAVREQALISYEQAVLAALGDVENALVALARSREREQALAIAAESARSAALLARNQYSAGLIDFQSVLDTERSVLSIEDSLASTRADGISALIRLYKALGGGWSPSENETQRTGGSPMPPSTSKDAT